MTSTIRLLTVNAIVTTMLLINNIAVVITRRLDLLFVSLLIFIGFIAYNYWESRHA